MFWIWMQTTGIQNVDGLKAQLPQKCFPEVVQNTGLTRKSGLTAGLPNCRTAGLRDVDLQAAVLSIHFCVELAGELSGRM